VKHELTVRSIAELARVGQELVFTPQVERDAWAVMTRPHESNGLGLGISEARELMRSVENVMAFAEDVATIHELWRELVERYEVKGKQVHDANHVAAMLSHGIEEVLTFDERDFRRYVEIRVVMPRA